MNTLTRQERIPGPFLTPGSLQRLGVGRSVGLLGRSQDRAVWRVGDGAQGAGNVDSANFSGSLWVRDGTATGPRQPGPVAHTLLPPTTCGPRGRISLIASSGFTLPVLGGPGPDTQEGFASTAKQWRDPCAHPSVPPSQGQAPGALPLGGQWAGSRGREGRPRWPPGSPLVGQCPQRLSLIRVCSVCWMKRDQPGFSNALLQRIHKERGYNLSTIS